MVELVEYITKDAVKYLRAVKRVGGEISWGNERHSHLTNLQQSLNKKTGMWSNEVSQYKKGADECYDKGLMGKSDSGFHGSYIRKAITEKGYKVLELAKGKKI